MSVVETETFSISTISVVCAFFFTLYVCGTAAKILLAAKTNVEKFSWKKPNHKFTTTEKWFDEPANVYRAWAYSTLKRFRRRPKPSDIPARPGASFSFSS